MLNNDLRSDPGIAHRFIGLENIISLLKNDKHNHPVKRIIGVGILILLFWIIGLMAFMVDGQTHVI